MIWRQIPGYEGIYEISENGDVRRVQGGQGVVSGRVLRPVTNGHYLKVALSVGNHAKQLYVHHLVAAAFIGQRPKGPKGPKGFHLNHRDGIKTNNHYSNLEYVSALENTRHAIRNGKWNHGGEHNGGARLTWEKVREMRELKKQGWGNGALAGRYGVARHTVCWIVKGKRWREATHGSDQGSDCV